jgi:hypothetical protein
MIAIPSTVVEDENLLAMASVRMTVEVELVVARKSKRVEAVLATGATTRMRHGAIKARSTKKRSTMPLLLTLPTLLLPLQKKAEKVLL